MRGVITNLVTTIILVIVTALVAYQVYAQLVAIANLTGLWLVAVNLLGILAPVVLILLVLKILQG